MEDMFFYNIDKYVYEECSESEMKLFMEHIKSCEKCKAEYELALLYLNGTGIEVDEKKASYYFELAAMLEHTESQY